jgi:hypothetical protein
MRKRCLHAITFLLAVLAGCRSQPAPAPDAAEPQP